MRVSQPKKRGTEGFGTTVIDTRLGFCYFYQNAPQEVQVLKGDFHDY